jgi:hypothetical protein
MQLWRVHIIHIIYPSSIQLQTLNFEPIIHQNHPCHLISSIILWVFHPIHGSRLMELHSCILKLHLQITILIIKRNYMSIPKDLEKPCNLQIVYKWLKSMYGLRQSSHTWCQCFDTYLLSKGFQRIISNPTMYMKHTLNDIIYHPCF